MAAREVAPALTNWSFQGLSFSDDVGTDHWRTHTSEAFQRHNTGPPPNEGKTHHKNLSQWGLQYGKPGPPDSHFSTTSSSSYAASPGVMPATKRRSDKYIRDFENTRVPIGSKHGQAADRFLREEMYESTNQRFDKAMALHNRYEASKDRAVRSTGGKRRAASSVMLGRNVPDAPPQDFSSTTKNGYEWPTSREKPVPRHEMPQKNISTFLKPSGAVADGVGGTFATFTDHRKVNPQVYAPTTPVGKDMHYRTSNIMQFGDLPRGSYVVPGSAAAAIKQNQDDRSAVPFDHPNQAADGLWSSVTKDVYRGQQVRVEDRAARMVQRETLGALRHS